jgi:hypothetical protein
MRLPFTLLYIAIAALLALHCYRNSMFDIDLLSYAGNVALFDSSDPIQVHRVVYGFPLTARLRGLDEPGGFSTISGRWQRD